MSEALERLLPYPGTSTAQSEVVRAPPDRVFATLKSVDLGASRPIRAAAWIRMLPARLLGAVRDRPPPPSLSRARLGDLVEAGYWTVLADREPHELALGLAMWDRRVEAEGPTLQQVREPGPGAVSVGWAFTVEPLSGGRSLLTTETRTRPADDRARRRFRLYWTMIGPFAAATRRMVLRRVAAEAERAHTPAATVAVSAGT